MADGEENVDSMETDSASEGKGESPPKRPDNLCCYSQKECDLEKLKGFDFCHKHILEDKASPFKPCDFVSKTNGKKCANPAPKLADGQKTYCLLHTRDSELRKVLEAKTKKKKRKLSGQQDEQPKAPTSKPGPGRPAGVRNYTKRPKVLDLGEYRRDDVLRVESSWHGDYESDSESIDNEMDDPLRHAGVWTAEEVTKVCRDKLLRLRSLYMSQFERLKHVYKNKRRKYLLATGANEEGVTVGGRNGTKPNESLSAMHIASRCYNKRYRNDALLQKQSKEKRLGTTSRNQILPHQRCGHYTDGNRCTSKIVPFAKYCLKHICHDTNQQLFLPCSQMIGAEQSCGAAVPNVSNHERCILHLPHTSDLSVVDLEQELQQAQERQIIKDKEIEGRRKAALEIAKSEALAAERGKKPEDSKTLGTSSTPTTPQTNVPESQQKETPPTMPNFPCKLSGSPVTNLQIKIQPEKQPEIVCKNLVSSIAPMTTQHDSKVGNSVTPSTTSTTSTAGVSLTTSGPSDVNTSSIPSKTHDKPTNKVAPQQPLKSSISMKSMDTGPVTDPNPPLPSANKASGSLKSSLIASSNTKQTPMLVDSSVSSKEPAISEVSKSSVHSENINKNINISDGGSIGNPSKP
ncbi:KAT8 regulatory NSL complex subunit 2-like isoform X2 [Dendronephthya gigantea]|uniref:KAT8 regulatory NSL complex subunit 2-like isoform X2 n=1 Tax=Dendronephthya gigantea TaxID=151771 RepID=UPI00106A03B3|nr:KAT8 regulatory NSL complex subunit 2-like isoform X2 [Dendronephthya gigantea]